MPMSDEPNAIDLVDLPTCKSWLGLADSNVDADATIQFLITGFSRYVLNKTGRDSFSEVGNYVEIYDGNNAQRMFLRNSPIVSVNSIQIGSYSVAASTGLTTPGWYIEQSKKSIALRTAAVSQAYMPFVTTPMRFAQGMGNIQVDYTAGYTEVPADLQEITMKVVSQNYRRKDWIDLASKSLSTGGGSAGTTRYRDWAMPPEAREVLVYYQRRALV